jgi:hypothetical protein
MRKIIQVTWLPVLEDANVSQFIAESDRPFGIAIKSDTGHLQQQIESQHDGLVNFVSVDVPLDADVEVVSE